MPEPKGYFGAKEHIHRTYDVHGQHISGQSTTTGVAGRLLLRATISKLEV